MVRDIERGGALCAAVLFAGAAWFALAQAQTPNGQGANVNVNGNMNGVMYANMNRNDNAGGDQPSSGRVSTNTNLDAHGPADWSETEAEDSAPSVRWTEVPPVYGFTNARVVKLRASADASSTVVATLDVPFEPESVEILEGARDHMRVVLRGRGAGGAGVEDVEGWVEWGAVLPHVTALVLDAQSGEVLRRVPLEAGVTSVAFSPDGRRAVFHGAGGRFAYEVDAEDYSPLRALEAGANESFGSVFYDAEAGGVLAPLLSQKYGPHGAPEWTLDILRAGDGAAGESAAQSVTNMKADRFVVAPDGLTGFAVRVHTSRQGVDAEKLKATVRVFNLRTLQPANSFTLEGGDMGFGMDALAFNGDGSELYLMLSGEQQRVAVFDTRTGARVREIPLGVAESGSIFFAQENQSGDSLLLKLWDHGGESGATSRAVWLAGEKLTAAGAGIDRFIEAGGERFAVNEEGTRLFKLDGDNRVRSKHKIDRPDIKLRKEEGNILTVHGFAASPDGKHLILFLAVPEDGC